MKLRLSPRGRRRAFSETSGQKFNNQDVNRQIAAAVHWNVWDGDPVWHSDVDDYVKYTKI